MAPSQQQYQDRSYLVLSDVDPRDLNFQSSQWQYATVIDDFDITFGGKPLSALYEEDRRRLSAASTTSNDDEEERRGRQRVRQTYSSTSHRH
jgi:hypothetical protein